jgi:hypothetical protein
MQTIKGEWGERESDRGREREKERKRNIEEISIQTMYSTPISGPIRKEGLGSPKIDLLNNMLPLFSEF